MRENGTKSVLAGICVSIGATAYLTISNTYIAYAMFFLGLWLILINNLKLFTSRVGYLSEFKYFKDNLPVIIKTLLLNLFGVCIYICLTQNAVGINIMKLGGMLISKVTTPLLSVFILSALCGALVDAAVSGYRQCSIQGSNSFITPFICIMGFVFIGGFHSIADAYFILTGLYYKLFHGLFMHISFTPLLLYWIIVLLGNTVGAMIWHFLLIKSNEGEKKRNGFERF